MARTLAEAGSPPSREKLIVKLPFQKATKAPKTPAMRKELPNWIQGQVDQYQVNNLDATIPFVDNQANQKMDRYMQGPVGAARTTDNVSTSAPLKTSWATSVFSQIVLPLNTPDLLNLY